LQRMEGHFVRGYGDRSRDVSLELYPDAVREAQEFLSGKSETLDRLARVTKLIEGYETPYGLELLSTVHWVVVHEDSGAKADPARAITGVLSWNDHKQRTFSPPRVNGAWRRLRDEQWF
jgi:hypothetical protein